MLNVSIFYDKMNTTDGFSEQAASLARTVKGLWNVSFIIGLSITNGVRPVLLRNLVSSSNFTRQPPLSILFMFFAGNDKNLFQM